MELGEAKNGSREVSSEATATVWVSRGGDVQEAENSVSRGRDVQEAENLDRKIRRWVCNIFWKQS